MIYLSMTGTLAIICVQMILVLFFHTKEEKFDLTNLDKAIEYAKVIKYEEFIEKLYQRFLMQDRQAIDLFAKITFKNGVSDVMSTMFTSLVLCPNREKFKGYNTYQKYYSWDQNEMQEESEGNFELGDYCKSDKYRNHINGFKIFYDSHKEKYVVLFQYVAYAEYGLGGYFMKTQTWFNYLSSGLAQKINYLLLSIQDRIKNTFNITLNCFYEQYVNNIVDKKDIELYLIAFTVIVLLIKLGFFIIFLAPMCLYVVIFIGLHEVAFMLLVMLATFFIFLLLFGTHL